MTSIALALLLGTAINLGPNTTKASTDSLKHQEIKEIMVYSVSNNLLSFPYVSVAKKDIEIHDFKTPAEALQNETGISLYRDGSWATSVNVRGMSEQRLLFLFDEDRLQTATDIAGSLSTIDLNTVEKIEVIKGASSVLYGTGAMGGVVNFISQRPQYTENLETSGKVSSAYHGVNNLWSNAANVQLTYNNWYLAMNGSYRTAQNTKTPQGTINNSQYNDASWGLRGGMKYGDNQELLVNFNHYGVWDAGLPGSNIFPATATVRYNSVKRNLMSAEYRFKDVSDLLQTLTFKAYTQNISRDVENQVNTSTVILPSSLNTTSGAKVTADLYFNDYNTMIVGAETWVRKSETARLKINLASDTTVIGEQPTPNANMLDAGIFSNYKLILSPRYWTLNLGARADYIRTDNDSAFSQIFKYIIADGNKTNVNITKNLLFSPVIHNQISYAAHVDLEYTPTQKQKIGLSLANSYRVASIEERFKYIDQAGIIRMGNPTLKPEKGLFSNLSYSYTGKRFFVKAEIFANYLSDLIAEKQSTITNASGNLISALVYTNVDKALYSGAEINLSWIISKAFWLNTNASYVQAKNTGTNEFLTQIPPAHGIFTLNYKLENKFQTSLSTQWAATQNENATTETATEGHVIFNYDIHSNPISFKKSYFQLFAGIDNILDKAYKNHLYSSRGLDFYEPGRNIYMKLKWGW